MICFDFDGVIADSHDFWLRVCRETLAEFDVCLAPEARPFARLDPLTFEQLGRDLEIEPTHFATRMARRAEASTEIPSLFPDIANLLPDAAELAPLAILSSSRAQFIKTVLAYHGLAPYFVDVFGGGSGRSKADTLKSIPAAQVMIGDAVSDIMAARAAGIPAIAVTWGWQDRNALAAADVVVDTCPDLLSALRHMCSS